MLKALHNGSFISLPLTESDNPVSTASAFEPDSLSSSNSSSCWRKHTRVSSQDTSGVTEICKNISELKQNKKLKNKHCRNYV